MIAKLKELVKKFLTRLKYFGFFSKLARKHRLKKQFNKRNKIRVAFYCDLGSEWTAMEQLYLCLREDERFCVTLLALPQTDGGRVVDYRICSFFDSLGYNYVKLYDEATQTWVQNFSVDYMIYTTHYASKQALNFNYKKMRKNAKLCYIPYATCVAKGEIEELLFGFEELKYYDVVFAENDATANIYRKYQKTDKAKDVTIATVGSAKFESIKQIKNISHTQYRQVVMYCPRWNMTEGFCSFLDLYPDAMSYIKDNKDTLFVFRPHPLMESSFKKDWGEGKWQNFIANLNAIENVHYDNNPSYLNTFSTSTVFISDVSSMPYEYILTNKPVVYMDKDAQLNEFGCSVAQGFYKCSNAKQLKTTLEDLKNGNDPLASTRQEIIDNEYKLSDGNSALRMRDYILKDFEKQISKSK